MAGRLRDKGDAVPVLFGIGASRVESVARRRREADARRRETTQAAYVEEFAAEVLAFLDFAPTFTESARKLAAAVTAHATPVGSGTVARTKLKGLDDFDDSFEDEVDGQDES